MSPLLWLHYAIRASILANRCLLEIVLPTLRKLDTMWVSWRKPYSRKLYMTSGTCEWLSAETERPTLTTGRKWTLPMSWMNLETESFPSKSLDENAAWWRSTSASWHSEQRTQVSCAWTSNPHKLLDNECVLLSLW